MTSWVPSSPTRRGEVEKSSTFGLVRMSSSNFLSSQRGSHLLFPTLVTLSTPHQRLGWCLTAHFICSARGHPSGNTGTGVFLECFSNFYLLFSYVESQCETWFLHDVARTYRRRQDELAKVVLPNKEGGLGITASFSVSKLVGPTISIYDSYVTGNRGPDTVFTSS